MNYQMAAAILPDCEIEVWGRWIIARTFVGDEIVPFSFGVDGITDDGIFKESLKRARYAIDDARRSEAVQRMQERNHEH